MRRRRLGRVSGRRVSERLHLRAVLRQQSDRRRRGVRRQRDRNLLRQLQLQLHLRGGVRRQPARGRRALRRYRRQSLSRQVQQRLHLSRARRGDLQHQARRRSRRRLERRRQQLPAADGLGDPRRALGVRRSKRHELRLLRQRRLVLRQRSESVLHQGRRMQRRHLYPQLLRPAAPGVGGWRARVRADPLRDRCDRHLRSRDRCDEHEPHLQRARVPRGLDEPAVPDLRLRSGRPLAMPDRRCRHVRRLGRHRQPAVHRARKRTWRSDLAAVSTELVAQRLRATVSCCRSHRSRRVS